jgi:hypothetical protein
VPTTSTPTSAPEHVPIIGTQDSVLNPSGPFPAGSPSNADHASAPGSTLDPTPGSSMAGGEHLGSPSPATTTPDLLASASTTNAMSSSTASGYHATDVHRPRTKLQGGIRKPKVYTDGTVKHNFLTTSSEPHNLEDALHDTN